MDGVLIDSYEGHFVAWQALASECGRTFPRDLFAETFGMHNGQILPMWLGADARDLDLGVLSARKETLFRELAGDRLQPLEGAVELVRALADEGFRLAVGSSAPRANVDFVLGVLGLAGSFAGAATGDDVTDGKPHPEVFLKAAQVLELPPSRCVVIEDAPQGVDSGLAAGAKVVALTSTRPHAELQHAHRVVDQLSALTPNALRELLEA